MAELPAEIMGDASLRPSLRLLLAALYSLTRFEDRDDPFAWPSIAELQRKAGMTRSTVTDALRDAKRAGLVDRQKRSTSHGESWGYALAAYDASGSVVRRFQLDSPGIQTGESGHSNCKVRIDPEQESGQSNSRSPASQTSQHYRIQRVNQEVICMRGEGSPTGGPGLGARRVSGDNGQPELFGDAANGAERPPTEAPKSSLPTGPRIPASVLAKAKASGYSPEAVARVWAAQAVSRKMAAERLGLKVGAIGLRDGPHKRIAERFAEGYSEADLIRAVKMRGQTVTADEFKRWFNGSANWSSKSVAHDVAAPDDAGPEPSRHVDKYGFADRALKGLSDDLLHKSN